MNQTSMLLKLNYLMGLANMSSAVDGPGRFLDGPEVVTDWPTNMTSGSPFNFSADTAAGLIEAYLAKMFTVNHPTTIALLCLYAPVFLFSLAGNSFVIVMFVKDRRMRRVKSLFLVNLALESSSSWTVQRSGFGILCVNVFSASSAVLVSVYVDSGTSSLDRTRREIYRTSMFPVVCF